MTICCMCIACWITKTTRTHARTHTHTLTTCTNYCFSTATMVPRMRLIVPLYVHRLSCYVMSIQCCRCQHCPVKCCCYQLPCNVPSCKAHLYRRALACHLITSTFRIRERCCLRFLGQVSISCSTIRNTCGIYQILNLDRVLQCI